MNAEEIFTFMKKVSQYLIQYLNKGSFEGVTGCTPEIMMRLMIAADLVYIVRYTESKEKPGVLAIKELF